MLLKDLSPTQGKKQELNISSSRRPTNQVMYWQHGEMKIQTPSTPQALQENYKSCFMHGSP